MTAGYADRLVDEYATLEENTTRLSEFVGSEEFGKLTLQEQSYLEAQLPVQQRLLEILQSRVAASKTVAETKKDAKKEEKKVEVPVVTPAAKAPEKKESAK